MIFLVQHYLNKSTYSILYYLKKQQHFKYAKNDYYFMHNMCIVLNENIIFSNVISYILNFVIITKKVVTDGRQNRS